MGAGAVYFGGAGGVDEEGDLAGHFDCQVSIEFLVPLYFGGRRKKVGWLVV